MKYKIDKYAVFHNSKDEKFIYGFNFRNGALAQFSKNNQDLIDIINNKGTDSPLVLIRNQEFSSNFLISDLVDEKNLIKERFREIQNNSKELNLTILTTLACNFSCYYCYEKRESIRITQETINNIISLIEKNIPNLERLGICWYGGEPLLVKDEIIQLNKKIKIICEINSIQFSSKVVTNAYLLDENVGFDLYTAGINEIQVSFDGPRDIHDKVRHQHGKPTFDRIVNNISINKDRFNFIIRVNVSKDNELNLDELLQQLSDKDINTKSTIYFANLHSNGVGCSDMSEPQIDGLIKTSDFLKQSIKLKSKALDLGFKIRNPLSTITLCSAVIKGGMVIEPDGKVKKCYLDVSNNTESIANISEKIIPIHNIDSELLTTSSIEEKWVNYDPFTNEDCSNCKVLPICFSGCPWEAMKGVPTKERCHPLKTGLEEYFDFIFNSIDNGANFDPVYKTLQKSFNNTQNFITIKQE